MLGGYQILDLRSIDLSHGTSESSISDALVLSQLLNIREHIQKTYDFGKPLHNQLKPLLIRYRDKKVGEKHEVALYGNIEVINTYYKFRIIANNEGEQLTINVEFEEKTDEYDNKYWDIKTAKILLTSEVAIFENITDKNGHKRFIEGDIIFEEITGFQFTYGKWSLSGSHLLIVVAGEIANTTVVNWGTKIAELKDLPNWIYEKLIPVSTLYVDAKTISLYNAQLGTQNVTGLLRKISNKIDIALASITASDDRSFRIAFDLLIDNASE